MCFCLKCIHPLRQPEKLRRKPHLHVSTPKPTTSTEKKPPLKSDMCFSKGRKGKGRLIKPCHVNLRVTQKDQCNWTHKRHLPPSGSPKSRKQQPAKRQLREIFLTWASWHNNWQNHHFASKHADRSMGVGLLFLSQSLFGWLCYYQVLVFITSKETDLSMNPLHISSSPLWFPFSLFSPCPPSKAPSF